MASSRSSSPFRASPKPKRLSLPIPTRRAAGPYAPSSAASDVSRILDPAYASSSSAGHSPDRRAPTAYVDHAGELHDPDFREFPVLPSPKRRSASGNSTPARPTWESGYTSPHAHTHGGAALGLGLGAGVRASRYALDADEDVDVLDGEDGWAARRRWSSAYAPSPTRYGGGFGLGPAPYAPTLDGSPVSDASDDRPLRAGEDADADEEDDPLGFGRTPRRRLSRWRRRTSRADTEDEKELGAKRVSIKSEAPLVEEPEALDDLRTDLQRERSMAVDDEVPSCSHTLRRRYQALAYRLRFGVFRAKRKLKRKLHSAG